MLSPVFSCILPSKAYGVCLSGVVIFFLSLDTVVSASLKLTIQPRLTSNIISFSYVLRL